MDMKSSSNKILMALVIFLSTFFTLIELRQNGQQSICKKRAKRRNSVEHTMDFKIVGGEDASVKEYPFVVSLQVRCNHVCGGSIITELFILTAAHCVVSTKKNNSWSIKDPLDYNIVAGQTVLDLGECQFRDVKEIYVHSGYNVSVQGNDIALLEIFDHLEWTNYTKIVELFSGRHLSYESHDFCTVIGWGTREAYVEVSENQTRKLPQNNNLQQVDLPPSSSNTCENYFNVNKAPHLFDETKLCVILSGGKDACRGDSGGPFICNGIQYGIVSFGIGCAQPNMPALFTNVSAFHKWIFGVMNNTEKFVVSRMVEALNNTRVLTLQDERMIQRRSMNAQSQLKYSTFLEVFLSFIILIFLITYD